MIEELVAALKRSAENLAAKSNAETGPILCGGADLRDQREAWKRGGSGAVDIGGSLYRAMINFPKPLIGMVHGAVAGARRSIPSSCDLRIAAAGIRISLPEINIECLGGSVMRKRHAPDAHGLKADVESGRLLIKRSLRLRRAIEPCRTVIALRPQLRIVSRAIDQP